MVDMCWVETSFPHVFLFPSPRTIDRLTMLLSLLGDAFFFGGGSMDIRLRHLTTLPQPDAHEVLSIALSKFVPAGETCIWRLKIGGG